MVIIPNEDNENDETKWNDKWMKNQNTLQLAGKELIETNLETHQSNRIIYTHSKTTQVNILMRKCMHPTASLDNDTNVI